MKKIITCLLLSGSLICSAQQITKTDSVDFSKLINNFKEIRRYGLITPPDPVKLPVVHQMKEYTIELSDNPLAFNIRTVVLQSPLENKLPVSFSVLYQDRLISLFEPGIFVCHSIPSMNRDLTFEKKLNTKKFKYHWLIDNQLIGKSGKKYYFYDPENGWTKYDLPLPIKNKPILFDDDSYLCFRDCHGEWGGTIYFFNKTTHNIHYTEATCANSVLKNNGNYFVFSHLGHMMGSAQMKKIPDPAKLPQVKAKQIDKTVNGQALGYTDKSNASQTVFDYFNIEIFSSFLHNNKNIYLVHWIDVTFLAEIENNRILIINPLFNNGLYTHEPITRSYGNTVLINLDFDETGCCNEISEETSGIIIQDKALIKYIWDQDVP